MRNVAILYVSTIGWSGGKGFSRSSASGLDSGASPSTRAIPGFVPGPPRSATNGPASTSTPITTSATSRRHRLHSSLVARKTAETNSVPSSVTDSSIPSGRVK